MKTYKTTFVKYIKSYLYKFPHQFLDPKILFNVKSNERRHILNFKRHNNYIKKPKSINKKTKQKY